MAFNVIGEYLGKNFNGDSTCIYHRALLHLIGQTPVSRISVWIRLLTASQGPMIRTSINHFAV